MEIPDWYRKGRLPKGTSRYRIASDFTWALISFVLAVGLVRFDLVLSLLMGMLGLIQIYVLIWDVMLLREKRPSV